MVNIVDYDIGTGGDYASISAWEAATDYDIVASDEQINGFLIENLTENSLAMAGATTDSTRFRRLQSETNAGYDLPSSTGRKWTKQNGAAVQLQEPYFQLKQLWIYQDLSIATASRVVDFSTTSGDNCLVDQCLLEQSTAATHANNDAILYSNGDAPSVRNTVIRGTGTGSNGISRGLTGNWPSGTNIDNVLCYKVRNTGVPGGSAANFRNVVCVGSGTIDWTSGTYSGTVTNNASSDTSVPGTSAQTNVVIADEFVDGDNGDWDLDVLTATKLLNTGADRSAAFTHDYRGTTRSDTWDIGAYFAILFTGTGAGSFPVPTGTGSGTLVFTGTGAGSFPVPVGGGSGQLIFSAADGTGSFALPFSTASGSLVFTGTSDAFFPIPFGAGSGTLSFVGTGDALFPVPFGDGNGLLTFIGTDGTGAFPLPFGTGSGSLVFTGTGDGLFPLPFGTGSGSLVFTGTSDGFFPIPFGDGVGSAGNNDITGTGDAFFQVPFGTGSGSLLFTGIGDALFSLPFGTGSGSLIFSATGDALFPPPFGTGSGSLIFDGTGAALFPVPLGDGSGFVLFSITGTGDAFFPLPFSAGMGAISLLGCNFELEGSYNLIAELEGTWLVATELEGTWLDTTEFEGNVCNN